MINMKKIFKVSMLGIALLGLAACGDKKEEATTTKDLSAIYDYNEKLDPNEAVTINMFQNAPEYSDQFNQLYDEYKKLHPNVTINLEITQSDYATVLKTKLNSSSQPDVFSTNSGEEIESYKDYSLDLSGTPLEKQIDSNLLDSFSADGKLYGIPFKTDAFGLIYNKDLFKKAGISEVPKTLDELEDVCQKLDAKGIQPFTTGFKESWVNKQVFQQFVSTQSAGKPKEFVESLNTGEDKISNYPLLTDNWFRLVDLVKKYGDKKPLETDLNAELTAFATNKAAMIFGQGTWVEGDILKVDDKMPIGFTAWPISDNPDEAKIVLGSDLAIRINKNSKVKDWAVDLFNFMYTSDYGKKWFKDIAKVIPPRKDVSYPDRPIANQVEEIKKEYDPLPLTNIYSMEAFQTRFGETMQKYYFGDLKKEQAISEIEKAYVDLGSAH